MKEPTALPTSDATEFTSTEWWPVTNPPEAYEIVYLLFADGKIRRGTWNGKIWWGYDERIHRSGALEPTAWRAFSDVRSRIVASIARASASKAS